MRRYINNGREPNTMNKELLLSRMKKNGDCWEWIGARTCDGYGRIGIQRREYRVHRVAALLWKGFDIDSDLLICHYCDNPPCFNPEHLFIGTVKDNSADQVRKGRGVRFPGELSPVSRLKADDIRQILSLIDSGMKQKDIATKFKISRGHITGIKQGHYWTHIWEQHYAIK